MGLLLLATAVLLVGRVAAQRPAPVEPPFALQPVPSAIVPTQFYVAAVRDERSDRQAVAYLLAHPAKPGTTAPVSVLPLDLQGGGLNGLRQFFSLSVPRNAALRPVTIRVRECRLNEKPGTPGYSVGSLTLSLSFDWQRDGKVIHLTDYRGTARFARPLRSTYASAEPVLRQALVEGLKYFDQWMNREAVLNSKLAGRLQVHRTDAPYAADGGDTLFYSVAHPLTLEDFRGVPRPNGRYGGAVFPSFSYTAEAQTRNGVLHLNLNTKVFVVRSGSWISPTSRDAYTLNHEQRHFDLVKLVAERFKRKVTPDSLTLDNYNARMQYQYLQSWWEMNRLQERYDGETGGGQNQAAQQRWDVRIEAELRQYGVKR
ncbi:hypothetical protein B0919_16770 [Hymenobacter sp. CRA2]|nr:hypothetical protein B0919_16770 [Hymenobacter sp. CRA2]